MKTDNVTQAKKHEDSSIELTIADVFTGTKIKKRYLAIRGGISWPTAKAPAYFCVLGQEYIAPDSIGDAPLPGVRILLAEHYSKALSLRSFYGKLCDAASLILCRSFYTELPEERLDCGFTSDLGIYAKKQDVEIWVQEAPNADDFLLGVSRINSALDEGKLKLPTDSKIHLELRNIIREDLAGKPEEVFPAINGLRHVLSSYLRNTPRLQKPYRMPPPPKLLCVIYL